MSDGDRSAGTVGDGERAAGAVGDGGSVDDDGGKGGVWIFKLAGARICRKELARNSEPGKCFEWQESLLWEASGIQGFNHTNGKSWIHRGSR